MEIHNLPFGRGDLHPDNVAILSREAYSFLLSNLPSEISIVEQESMFCRAGKIIDCFIPLYCTTGRKRGIGFVRFKTEREALNAIELIKGRSLGLCQPCSP